MTLDEHMMKFATLLVLLCCASASAAQDNRGFEVYVPYASSPLMGGLKRTLRVAITSESEWERLWREIQSRSSDEALACYQREDVDERVS
jgi:hypothetical protein